MGPGVLFQSVVSAGAATPTGEAFLTTGVALVMPKMATMAVRMMENILVVDVDVMFC